MKIKVEDLNASHLGMYYCDMGTWKRIYGLEVEEGWTRLVFQYKNLSTMKRHSNYIELEEEETSITVTPAERQLIDNALCVYQEERKDATPGETYLIDSVLKKIGTKHDHDNS